MSADSTKPGSLIQRIVKKDDGMSRVVRVAALYDIHGNLPALEAVVKDVYRIGVDAIVVGGDVIPGPMPTETLSFLLDLGVPRHFIHGNGERDVLAVKAGGEATRVPEQFRDVIRWTAEQLDDRTEELVAGWPRTLTLRNGGLGDVMFCHATPRDDNEIFTRQTPESRLLPVFGGLDVSVAVCGHTHMQFDRMIGRVRVVNAGSVGMPFGSSTADWLLLGPDIQLQHTSYDHSAAALRLGATQYPGVHDFVARYVADSPTEEAMLQAFERVELK